MKPSVAFGILNQNRKNKVNGNKPFAVVSINKDGSPSKADRNSLQLARDLGHAEAIKARFETDNPGRSFVIVGN